MSNNSASPVDAAISATLRAKREAAGMTPAELAQQMKTAGFMWTAETVQAIENVEKQLEIGESNAAAKILGFSLPEFFKEIN